MRIFPRIQDATKIYQLEEFMSETKKQDNYSSMITPQRHLYAKPLNIDNFEDKVVESSFVRPPKLHHNLDKILRTEGI